MNVVLTTTSSNLAVSDSREHPVSEHREHPFAEQRERRHIDPVLFLALRRASKRRSKALMWLAGAVATLPFVATAIYVFFIATPMYSSEARFAIRGAQSSSAASSSSSGSASMLSTGGGGALGGFVDGFAVRDFLQSRDAADQLEGRVGFSKLISKQVLDPLVSVPDHPTPDQLYAAYQSFVSVRYNMIEQIVVLDVQAFKPEDAVTLTKALLAITEDFADKMNRRALDDSLKVAKEQVQAAEEIMTKATLAIADWRSKNSTVDPTADAAMLTTLIAQLEGQLATARTSIAWNDANGVKDSPHRLSLVAQTKTLQDQIEGIRNRLGGGNDATSAKLAGYEALKIDQQYAENNLSSMRQSLEQARVGTLLQQKFVAAIAAPQPNTIPAYPAKFTAMLSALAVGFALAFSGSIVVGLVRSGLRR